MAESLVYVIGDSISMQYGPYLKRFLPPALAYARKGEGGEAEKDLPGPIEPNGGNSVEVLAYLRALGNGQTWRPGLLLLNCGLHDIHADPDTGIRQVPLEAYRRNLQEILALLKKENVRVVWVRTTAADNSPPEACGESFQRYAADVDVYNAAADEIMGAAGVALLDLNGFTKSLGGPEVFCDHVHFCEEIREKQGAFVAGYVAGLLAM